MALSGKVVVLTGASSGIGSALAKQAAREGAKLVIAARRKAELEAVAHDCGGEQSAFAVVCDVTKRADHQALLDAAIRKWGRVDCWVNNAGVGLTKTVQDLTDDDLDFMFLVNTKSVLYGMQAVVPYFKTQKRGQVVNVGSLLGRVPWSSVRSAYSASKAAMNSLSVNMRVDLQNEGFPDIRIAVFSPGLVATDFGVNSVNGGPDSKQLPGAQPVAEVAEGICRMIANPDMSVDMYSKPNYKGMILEWYQAEDVRTVESKPPFVPPAAAAAGAGGPPPAQPPTRQ